MGQLRTSIPDIYSDRGRSATTAWTAISLDLSHETTTQLTASTSQARSGRLTASNIREITMPGMPESSAKRSLAICPLFESEVLIWLLLRTWNHPLAEDGDFRNQLLETATEVLSTAAAGSQGCAFIAGLPASDMNLIAAVWYAENRALEDLGADVGEDAAARLDWLAAVRRALPSCFCPQDHLM